MGVLPLYLILSLYLLQSSGQCVSSTAVSCIGTHLPNTSSTGDLYCASIPNSPDLGGNNGIVNCSGGAWTPIDLECTCFYNMTAPISAQLVNGQCGTVTCGGFYFNIPVGTSICGPGTVWYTCVRQGYLQIISGDTCTCPGGNVSSTTILPPAPTTTLPFPSPPTAPPSSSNCNSSSSLTNCLGAPIPVPQASGTEFCVFNSASGLNDIWTCVTGTWTKNVGSRPCSCFYLSPPADETDGLVTTGFCHVMYCNGTGHDISVGSSACTPTGLLTCVSDGFANGTSSNCCAGTTTSTIPVTTTSSEPTTSAVATTSPTLTSLSTTIPSTTQPVIRSYPSASPLGPACFNVPLVGKDFPLCPDQATFSIEGCYAHPVTGLVYFEPATRTMQQPASGVTQGIHTYCFGDLSLPTQVQGMTPPFPDLNPSCDCAFINNGQVHAGEINWIQGTRTCNGDDLYCAKYNGSWSGSGQCTDGYAPSTTSTVGCVCLTDTRNFTQVIQYFMGGTWVIGIPFDCKVALTPVQEISHLKGYPLFGYAPADLSVKRSHVRSQVTQATLESQTLIVNTPSPNDTRISVSKDGINALYLCAEIQCLILLPDDFFYNSGVLTVRIYISDTLDQTALLPVSAFINCNIPRCIVCQEMVSDFMCFPVEFQVFIIVATIAAFLLIIFILYRLLCGGRAINCCKGSCKRVVNKFQEKFRSMRRSNSGQDVSETVEMSPFKVALVVLLVLPLALGSSCANGITIPVSLDVCSASGSQLSCTTTFSALVGIPAPGLDSCLSFVTTAGEVMATMTIRYDQMFKVAPLSEMYVTSSFSGASQSHKSCSHDFFCGDCASYNGITDPIVCGAFPFGDPHCLFDPNLANFPGISQCNAQCGCAGCNCFWCDSACVYSRAVLFPEPPYCTVYRPISINLRPQLIVNFTTNGESTITNVDVISLEQQVGSNFTLTVEGSLQGSDSFINDQRALLCQDGYAGLGFAALPNAPVAGGMGDIQYNSYNDLNPPVHAVFDPSIITSLYTSTVTNFNFHAPGMRVRSTFDSFPTLRGSTLWSASGPNMIGVDSNPGQILMTVASLRDVTLRKTVNIVCPKIVSGNISGCYSCDQGATVYITAHSRCSDGPVVVTSTGDCIVDTPTVNIYVADTIVTIRVSSSIPTPTCVISLTSTSFSDSISITGNLVRDNLIVVSNDTFSSNGTQGGPGIGLPDFADWFSGLADWAKGLLVTAIIVVSIIVGIIIFRQIWKAYQSWKLNKAMTNYRELPTVPALPQ